MQMQIDLQSHETDSQRRAARQPTLECAPSLGGYPAVPGKALPVGTVREHPRGSSWVGLHDGAARPSTTTIAGLRPPSKRVSNNPGATAACQPCQAQWCATAGKCWWAGGEGLGLVQIDGVPMRLRPWGQPVGLAGHQPRQTRGGERSVD